MSQESPPPLLAYQTPSVGPITPLRTRACSHARGNGTGSIALFLFLTLVIGGLFFFANNGLSNTILAIVLGLNGTAFLCCGAIYSMASVKIRYPNPWWENAAIVAGRVHLCVVITTTLLELTRFCEKMTIGHALALGILLVILISLQRMVSHIKSVRGQP